MKHIIQKIFNKFGYQVTKLPNPNTGIQTILSDSKEPKLSSTVQIPDDFNEFQKKLIEEASPFTMTSPERMGSLINAVEYIIKNNIEGDFVECGVWRGGCILIMIRTLMKYGVKDRIIHLYDTFEGMSEPTEVDISITGEYAQQLLRAKERDEEDHIWAYAPIEKVQKLLESTGYYTEKIKYHKGKVEDTIPKNIPSKIALLRLDTDWYESTKHELEHLYPLLVPSGVLIIDDYGHWQGARKAVDVYFQDKKILLNRIDYTGRIAVKP